MKKLFIFACTLTILFQITDVHSSGLAANGSFNAISGNSGSDTIGYLDVGATADYIMGNDEIRCTAVDSPINTGVVQGIYIYSDNDEATNDIEVGFYSGATPTTRVGTDAKRFDDVGTWSVEWHLFDVSDQSWTLSSGTSYWVCAFNSANASSLTIRYDDPAGENRYGDAESFASAWPATFTQDSVSGSKYSVKAVVSW